jgi:excisionase family DNA binding protein
VSAAPLLGERCSLNHPDNTHSDDRFLTTEEVSTLARVTTRTVCNWAASKKLPGIKLGPKLWRFRTSQVQSFLAGDRRTPDGH